MDQITLYILDRKFNVVTIHNVNLHLKVISQLDPYLIVLALVIDVARQKLRMRVFQLDL